MPIKMRSNVEENSANYRRGTIAKKFKHIETKTIP